jgi:hypothetical protein
MTTPGLAAVLDPEVEAALAAAKLPELAGGTVAVGALGK